MRFENEGRAAYIAECPNHREAARILRETLRECGFGDEVCEIEVTDSAQARTLAFIGSPSIRIEGKDIESIEPVASKLPAGGLSCRTYLVAASWSAFHP